MRQYIMQFVVEVGLKHQSVAKLLSEYTSTNKSSDPDYEQHDKMKWVVK